MPIPPGKSKQTIPVPAPTLPSATSDPSFDSAPSTSSIATVRESAMSPSSHSPTTGSTTFSGPRPEASTPAWKTVPTACDPHRYTGVSITPRSSISSFAVSSPTPLTTAVPARAGRAGGAMTVTPVRCPLAAWRGPPALPGRP